MYKTHEDVAVTPCVQCGEPHNRPGTICGWCHTHIQEELVRPASDDGSKDLSLSEALQWGEENELFAA